MAIREEILKIKEVDYYYDKKKILEKINLNILKGDFLGIIGPNGGGKTTLIKLILGLLKPKKGSIRLFGEKLERFKHWQKIGYVAQKASNVDQKFPASVREIVLMGCLASKKFPRMISGEDKEKINRILKKVNMQNYSDRKIGELSGGQQQRVFIARALISSPELLILDEPTVGIDKKTQDKFYNFLRDLNLNDKITIIIISHDVGYITKYVTKVACVNKKLIFHGTHHEFCSSNVIQKILGHEKHIVCHDHV